MTAAAITACILAAILGIENIALSVLAGRFALQSFQQNSYRFSEYRPWLSINWKKASSTIVTAVLAVAAILLAALVWPLAIVIGAIAIAFTAFALYYFNFLRKHHKKKALAYTARVKRLIITDVILSAVVCALGVVAGVLHGAAIGNPMGWLAGLGLALAVLAPLQILLVPLAGTIMGPIERSNNQRYIDEARQILSTCPDLKIVGITGSYGKTSMKHYLAELLRNRYDVLITPGNYNTTLGVVRTIRERLKPTHEVFLCEMGARNKGDIAEICDLVHPSMGIVTSIGPQHLDTFGDLDTVKATKFELVDAVLAAGAADAAGAARVFLNFDSEPVREKAVEAGLAAGDFTSYGACEQAGYKIAASSTSREGTKFTIAAPDGATCEYSTKLIGEHNVINIAGAIAVAHELGVPLEDMRVPVRRLKPVEHRLECKRSGNVTIIDDAYNSNPIGSRAALDVLALFDDGLRILVTPGMVELGDEQFGLNESFAEHAAGICDDVIIVGSHNRDALLAGLEKAEFPQMHTHCCTTIQDALRYAGSISAGQPRTILMENDLPDIY